MSAQDICPGCMRKIPLARKESLSRIKVEILMSAGQLVAERLSNRFKLRDVPACTEPSHYNNFQKLRYHGLIAKATVNGRLMRNEWVITRNGFRFLRGTLEIPKFVKIRQNHIVERAAECVSLSQVWRGAPYLETSFEYFDEDNNPIGVRPQADTQVALL